MNSSWPGVRGAGAVAAAVVAAGTLIGMAAGPAGAVPARTGGPGPAQAAVVRGMRPGGLVPWSRATLLRGLAGASGRAGAEGAAVAGSGGTGPEGAAATGSGGVPGVLYSVSALSAGRAWAVGSAGARSLAGGPSGALIVGWNGRAWRRARVPALGDSALLEGVAAVSARDAWAVGDNDAGPHGGNLGKTVLLHWNGRTWRRVASPVAGAEGLLENVAASSARNVWAVGVAGNGRMLVVRWNGIAWRRVPVPQTPGDLTAVATTSPGNVWAVGAGSGRALILHWNGRKWSRVRNSISATVLDGVTVTGGEAWAVGANFGNQIQPVILRWNGVRWSKVAGPRQQDFLVGVAALSANRAWAVGANEAGVHPRAVTLRWNGRVWGPVAHPGLGLYTVLVGVTATSASDAWAVGALDRPRHAQTVIAHWNGIRWVPASIMK
jgi:hypothetical protein